MKRFVLVSKFKDLQKKFTKFYNGDFEEDLGKEYLLDLVYKNLVEGICKIILNSSQSKTGDEVVFEFERINPFIKYLKFEGYQTDNISVRDWKKF